MQKHSGADSVALGIAPPFPPPPGISVPALTSLEDYSALDNSKNNINFTMETTVEVSY